MTQHRPLRLARVLSVPMRLRFAGSSSRNSAYMRLLFAQHS
jgi:hypothetical protein